MRVFDDIRPCTVRQLREEITKYNLTEHQLASIISRVRSICHVGFVPIDDGGGKIFMYDRVAEWVNTSSQKME